MKATDLMIGDWVEVNNTALQIAALGTIKAGFAGNEYGLYYHYYDNIEPISLTTEILQANGFDCSDEEVVRYNFTDGDYQGHFSLRRMYSGNTPNGWSFFAFNVLTIIDYVHELQHALRLCGIGKNIEL